MKIIYLTLVLSIKIKENRLTYEDISEYVIGISDDKVSNTIIDQDKQNYMKTSSIEIVNLIDNDNIESNEELINKIISECQDNILDNEFLLNNNFDIEYLENDKLNMSLQTDNNNFISEFSNFSKDFCNNLRSEEYGELNDEQLYSSNDIIMEEIEYENNNEMNMSENLDTFIDQINQNISLDYYQVKDFLTELGCKNEHQDISNILNVFKKDNTHEDRQTKIFYNLDTQKINKYEISDDNIFRVNLSFNDTYTEEELIQKNEFLTEQSTNKNLEQNNEISYEKESEIENSLCDSPYHILKDNNEDNKSHKCIIKKRQNPLNTNITEKKKEILDKMKKTNRSFNNHQYISRTIFKENQKILLKKDLFVSSCVEKIECLIDCLKNYLSPSSIGFNYISSTLNYKARILDLKSELSTDVKCSSRYIEYDILQTLESYLTDRKNIEYTIRTVKKVMKDIKKMKKIRDNLKRNIKTLIDLVDEYEKLNLYENQ